MISTLTTAELAAALAASDFYNLTEHNVDAAIALVEAGAAVIEVAHPKRRTLKTMGLESVRLRVRSAAKERHDVKSHFARSCSTEEARAFVAKHG